VHYLVNIVVPSAIGLGNRCVNLRGEEMAGQAGWYRAPGEEGILRYWNGTSWTDHRQPAPVALVAPEAQPVVAEPEPESDPMAEYERQFEKPSFDDADFERPSFEFDHRPFDSAPTPPSTTVEVVQPQPQYRPQAALSAAPIVAAPTPEFAGQPTSAPRQFTPKSAPASLGPIALGPAVATPSTVDPPQSEFERVFNEMTAVAEASKRRALEHDTAAIAVAAPAVPGQVVARPIGIAPNRKSVLAAVKGMAAAVIIILLGIAAMMFFSLQSTVGAGEAKTNAIVVSLGSTSGNGCTPIARFAVAGKSYTANSSSSISPCPIGLGESVNVVYSASDPASAARIEVGSSLAQYLWPIPIVGGLVFVGALITFIVRAGSIIAGVTILREGRASSKEPAVAE
jgi:hypothetical protein